LVSVGTLLARFRDPFGSTGAVQFTASLLYS
jgi:hypothetical protein